MFTFPVCMRERESWGRSFFEHIQFGGKFEVTDTMSWLSEAFIPIELRIWRSCKISKPINCRLQRLTKHHDGYVQRIRLTQFSALSAKIWLLTSRHLRTSMQHVSKISRIFFKRLFPCTCTTHFRIGVKINILRCCSYSVATSPFIPGPSLDGVRRRLTPKLQFASYRLKKLQIFYVAKSTKQMRSVFLTTCPFCAQHLLQYIPENTIYSGYNWLSHHQQN